MGFLNSAFMSEMFVDYQDHLRLLGDRSIPFLFLTGNAGTGKSTLINHFADTTLMKVVKVAPTGLAALRIGGSTIHRFFGLRADVPYFSPTDKGSMKVKAFDVLIIDEISMVRSDVMQVIYNTLTFSDPLQRPWGGKLVRVVGDLLQLPPVVNDQRDLSVSKYLNTTYGGRFFFNAHCLDSIPQIVLEKVHRQRDDRFIKMLNFMRQPEPKQSHTQYLLQEVNKLIRRADDEAVRLCTVRAKVVEINALRLSMLQGESEYYKSIQVGDIGFEKPAEDIIELKVGCRVMLLANTDGYVNGHCGTYIGKGESEFEVYNSETGLTSIKKQECLFVKLDEGYEVCVRRYTWEKVRYKQGSDGKLIRESEASFTQFPICLGYAITIHKSQGLTLPKVHLDFGDYGCFDHGQAYVAFSRAQTLEGISIQQPVKARDFKFDVGVFSPKLQRVL